MIELSYELHMTQKCYPKPNQQAKDYGEHYKNRNTTIMIIRKSEGRRRIKQIPPIGRDSGAQ